MAEKKRQTEKQIPPPASGRPAKLYRSAKNRMIGGVCGGFANYFNIDVNVLRIVWVVAVFFGGFGLLAYILSWIIIPENPDPSTETGPAAAKPQNSNLLWGMILIVLGAYFLFEQLDWFDYYPFHFGWHWRPFWFWNFRFDLLLPIAIIIIGVIYLLKVLRKDEATPEQATGGTSMDKKLTRSAKDRMIAGVCGGLAHYFNVDPSLVRIAYALLTLAGGVFFGIIAYIVMMIVIPEETAVELPSGEKGAKAKSRS